MGFKVIISDHIWVPVHLKIRDGNELREFKFHVTGKRLSVPEMQGQLREDNQATVGEFLANNITGWRGQSLVLDEETGAPAEFSPQALAALLNIGGVASILYATYLTELAASDGAEGRRKN